MELIYLHEPIYVIKILPLRVILLAWIVDRDRSISFQLNDLCVRNTLSYIITIQ